MNNLGLFYPEMSQLINHCLNCIRRDWNATYKTGLSPAQLLSCSVCRIRAPWKQKNKKRNKELIKANNAQKNKILTFKE